MTSAARQLAVLFVVVMVDLIGFGVLIPILPYYAKSFGASATVLGVLLTCYPLMQLLGAPLWGRLSDRFGRRPVMLVTIAGTSLALLVLAGARSLVWLFAGRLLAGVFGANISVASAYVADVAPAGERTRYLGLIGAAFGVGFLVGPAIGGALAPYGFAAPVLCAAALAAANFVAACWLLREPERRAETTTRSLGLGATSELVRRLCAIAFLLVLAAAQLETSFAYYMLDRFGYGARPVAMLMVLMAVIMIAVQGGGLQPLVDRFGERRLVVAGACLLAASFAAVPWPSSVLVLIVPLAVSAFGRSIAQASLLGLVGAAAPPAERGAVMGIYQSSMSLARVVGPLLAGACYDAWRPGPFLLAALLMVGALSLSGALPERAAGAGPELAA